MPLAAATRLGPDEILGTLGAGGMGEVYRAHRPGALHRDLKPGNVMLTRGGRDAVADHGGAADLRAQRHPYDVAANRRHFARAAAATAHEVTRGPVHGRHRPPAGPRCQLGPVRPLLV